MLPNDKVNPDLGLQAAPTAEGLTRHTPTLEGGSGSPARIPRMMLRQDRVMQPTDVRNFNGLGYMKARQ